MHIALSLLSLCSGLYFAQRIAPRSLYNQLTALDGSFHLTSALQWDARGMKSFSYSANAVAWPEEPGQSAGTRLQPGDYRSLRGRCLAISDIGGRRLKTRFGST